MIVNISDICYENYVQVIIISYVVASDKLQTMSGKGQPARDPSQPGSPVLALR